MQVTGKNAVVFDEQRLFVDTLSMLLQRLEFFDIVYSFTNESEVRQFFNTRQSTPVYLFTDFLIPDCNVHHLISDIRRLCRNVSIIVVSNAKNKAMIQNVLFLSPEAFISKSMGISEIVDCMETLKTGTQYISDNLKKILADNDNAKPVRFTPKEVEVLNHIAKGFTINQIAELLNMSKHTVVAHRRNMLQKANCHSATALVSLGINSGYVNN